MFPSHSCGKSPAFLDEKLPSENAQGAKIAAIPWPPILKSAKYWTSWRRFRNSWRLGVMKLSNKNGVNDGNMWGIYGEEVYDGGFHGRCKTNHSIRKLHGDTLRFHGIYVFNNVISGFVWEGMAHRMLLQRSFGSKLLWFLMLLYFFIYMIYIYIYLYIYIYIFIQFYPCLSFFQAAGGLLVWFVFFPRFASRLLMIVQDLPEGLRPRDLVNRKNPSVIPHVALVTVPNLITLSIYIYIYR